MVHSAKANIRELAAGASRVPKEYRFIETQPKGHKGLCLNRDQELDSIDQYFTKQWAEDALGQLEQNDCIAYLITNAPGAGKTTLREEAGKRKLQKGITVIELNKYALADDSTLIDELLAHAEQDMRPKPTDDRLPLFIRGYKAIINHEQTPNIVAGTADILLTGGWLSITLAAYRLIRGDRERLRTIIEQKRPDTVKRALQALSEAHEGRFLITVDECHTWGDRNTDRSSLQRNLDYLVNPTVRSQIGLRGGGVLLSGLGDAMGHLDGLGLSRARVAWVGELEPADVVTVMEHHMGKATITAEYRDRVQTEWINHMSRTFSAWPQHSSVAGLIAAKTLQQAQKDGFHTQPEKDKELLEGVIACTARVVRRLYDDRILAAVERTYPGINEFIVGLANVSDGTIPVRAINLAIMDAAAADHHPELTGEEVRHSRLQLQRAGLIRPNVDPEADSIREISDYSIGIPSLRDYITTGTPPGEMLEYENRGREVLAEINNPVALARRAQEQRYGRQPPSPKTEPDD